MKFAPLACVMLIASALPSAALADDPKDPAMRNAAARARDREATRQLNLKILASVRARDAREWRTTRRAGDTAHAEYGARSQSYQDAMADYARDRAQYERDMANWRRATAACRAGDYSACD